MILADKIIELRKKNGWSQEDLAQKMDVSRQSISKWEGAQSVPDMNRILRLSEIFGVTTDFLLKDDRSFEEERETAGYDSGMADENDMEKPRLFSMEEASAFLDNRSEAAARISIGVMMCILSPVLLLILTALQEAGHLSLTEDQAAGTGLLLLLSLIGGAVALFVVTGLKGQRFDFLEKELIDTAYGVDGMVKERRERFRPAYIQQLTVGIVLCVMSVVPVCVSMILYGDRDLPMEIASAGLLVMVAIGVLLIVRVCMIWDGFRMVLEEGEYSRAEKIEKRKNQYIDAIYWLAVTAGYLAYSFVTGAWQRSWIVWPVAGLVYGIVTTVARMMRRKG